MAIKICPYCGEKFVARNNAKKYCSAKCQQKDYKTKKKLEIIRHNFNISKYTCRWCGKQFESNTPVEFCSAACRKAHRQKKKTDNKKNMAEIARINELARKEGLTYGQYLARHGYGGV